MSTTVKKNAIPVNELFRALTTVLVKVSKKYYQVSQQGIAYSRVTGRFYKRRRGVGYVRLHQASARGETAANDSGNLLRSINFRAMSSIKTVVEATADYAEILVDKLDRRVLADTTDAQKELDFGCQQTVNQFLK